MPRLAGCLLFDEAVRNPGQLFGPVYEEGNALGFIDPLFATRRGGDVLYRVRIAFTVVDGFRTTRSNIHDDCFY